MLVSTIIPTYNRVDDVVLAVESALGQTHPAAQHEILVVDDGSTDDTAAVLARYGDRIRYLRKANGGVSSARNHGIAQARGEVIAFLDSDDEWLPEKLALQVKLLRDRPAIDLVLTDVLVVDEHRRQTGVFHRRSTIPEDGWVLRHIVRNPALTPSTAMVRTRVARAIGGFDSSLPTAEDLDFHLRLALRHQIAVLELPLVRYMRSDAGLGNQIRTYRDYVFVVERFMEQHRGEISAEDRREALFAVYLRNARGLLQHGDVVGGVRLGVKSVPHLKSRAEALDLARLALTLGRSSAGRVLRRIKGQRAMAA